MVKAVAPGRVNLMGDHTDHAGGLVLPMAIDLQTVVEGERGGDVVELRSAWAGETVVVPLPGAERAPAVVERDGRTEGWAAYAQAVVDELRPAQGLRATISSDVPVGAGLSSSAALEVSLALALGFEGSPLELAQLAQRAEHAAVGVPCGIMDQLASAAGVAGHALRIDCRTLAVTPVPLPPDLDVVVVHSGEERSLAGSAYGERVAACEAAEHLVGPLPEAPPAAVEGIADPTVRRRARHVASESARVDEVVDAFGTGDRPRLRRALAASHASLRDDFEVSTPGIDALVAELAGIPGVVGARLTGAGFGGCVVALVEAGAPVELDRQMWRVTPSAGAHVTP